MVKEKCIKKRENCAAWRDFVLCLEKTIKILKKNIFLNLKILQEIIYLTMLTIYLKR